MWESDQCSKANVGIRPMYGI